YRDGSFWLAPDYKISPTAVSKDSSHSPCQNVSPSVDGHKSRLTGNVKEVGSQLSIGVAFVSRDLGTRGVMQGGDKSSSGMHTPHNIVRIIETMPKEEDRENGQGRIRVLRSYTGDEGKDNTGDSSKVKESSGEAAKRDTLRGANVGDCSTSRDRIAETSESCIP
ncbi:hypothetical protein Ancab_004059, partial [Ancistrocladus abbreviatus]